MAAAVLTKHDKVFVAYSNCSNHYRQSSNPCVPVSDAGGARSSQGQRQDLTHQLDTVQPRHKIRHSSTSEAQQHHSTQVTRMAARAAKAAAIAAQQHLGAQSPPPTANQLAPTVSPADTQQHSLALPQPPSAAASNVSHSVLQLAESQQLSSSFEPAEEQRMRGELPGMQSLSPESLQHQLSHDVTETSDHRSSRVNQQQEAGVVNDRHPHLSSDHKDLLKPAEHQSVSSEHAEQQRLSSEAAERDLDLMSAQLEAATIAEDDNLSPLQQLLKLCGQDVGLQLLTHSAQWHAP